MARFSFVTFILIFLCSNLFAQSDSIRLSDKSKDFFNTQLDSMDGMWVLQNHGAAESFAELPLDGRDKITAELAALEKQVPLKYSQLMHDYLAFYVEDHHTHTEQMLGMAKGLFPMMDSVFKSSGLPVELRYLALVKSALNPHFMSEKGASGPWQFMYSTGSLYELSIDSYIDQRRAFLPSTVAAAEMLKDLYKIYGDWQLVIAAYNCGPTNLNRAIRRAGTHKDFNKIYSNLPAPERDFYAAFVAMVYLDNNHDRLELEPIEIEWPLKTDTVAVNKKLHLGQVSEVLNKDLRLLRDLNPVYRRQLIPASFKTFTLVLPAEMKDSFLILKDSIYHYRDTFYFQLKPEPELSSGKTYASYKPNKPSGNHVAIYYTIKSGDNLGYISEWFDVGISDLRYWNNIRGNMIRAGQRLLIYVPKDKADIYRKYDKMTLAEKQRGEGKTVSVPKEKPQPVEELKPGDYTIYVVQKGDNPWSIAQKFPGVSDQDIMRWNNIRPRDLRPGQKLKIKKQ